MSKRRKQPQPRQVVQDHTLLTQAFEKEIYSEYSRLQLRSFDNHVCGRCSAEFYTMPAFLMHKKQCTNVWPVVLASSVSSSSPSTSPPSSDTKNLKTNDNEDVVITNDVVTDADKSFDLLEISSKPMDDCETTRNIDHGALDRQSQSSRLDCRTGVKRIQSALATLQRQQMLQLQLIKHIYGQLLKTKSSFDEDDDDDVENEHFKKSFDEFGYENSVTVPPESSPDSTPTIGVSFDSLRNRVMSSLKELERNVTQQLNEERKASVKLDKLYATRCQLCKKNVGNFKRLEVHLKKVHDTELAYFTHFCDRCYQCFTSERDLDEHSRNDHQEVSPMCDTAPVDDSRKENDDDGGNNHHLQMMYDVDSARCSTVSQFDENSLRNDGLTRSERVLTNLNVFSRSPGCYSDAIFGNNESSSSETVTCIPMTGNCTPLEISQIGPPTMVNIVTATTNGFADADREIIRFDDGEETANRRHQKLVKSTVVVKDDVDDDDDDWEALMEVTNTDESSKIRQLAGDVTQKITDPNQCIICHRILSCKSALQMHYRTHTGSRPFKCKVCQRAFTTKGNLKTHMSVHKTKAPLRMLHKCPLCQKAFTNAVILHQHLLNHNSDKITTLTPLEKPVPTPAATFYDDPTFTPVRATVTTTQQTGLLQPPSNGCGSAFDGGNNNKPNDTNSRPLSADNQPSTPNYSHSSSTPSSLGETGRFPVPYMVTAGCNPFSSIVSPNFQSAMNRSTVQRPDTTCNICLKTFACYSALEIHYRSHTKEKPFKCNFCGRGFSTKGNLKQHLLTHKLHGSSANSVPSSSDSSTVTTPNNNQPKNESWTRDFTVPPTNHKVENGDKVSTRSNGESRTISTSSSYGMSPLESIQNMWARADEVVTTGIEKIANSRKQQHVGNSAAAVSFTPPIPNNKNLCQVCLKHFSSGSALQIHMRTHTGDRPFVCKICNRSFTTKGNLKVHMGTHNFSSADNRRGRRFFSDSSPEALNLFDKSKECGRNSLNFPSHNNEKIIDNSSHTTTNGTSSAHRNSSSTTNVDVSSSFNAIMQSSLSHAPPHFVPFSSSKSPPFFDPQSSQLNVNPFGSAMDFSSTFQQNSSNGFASPLNLPSTCLPPADKSAEAAMLMMWRTVCSVCHKVCSSAAELEIHLKNHLRQVDLNGHNVLKI